MTKSTWWTPCRLDRHGWVAYPHPPRANGNIREDLPVINALIGSSLYEWMRDGEVIYIRRVCD
jgi:hypothetical protein